MPKSFKCWNCPVNYTNDRSLRKHYEKFPEHRPPKQEIKPAKQAVENFLNVPNINRQCRLKEFFKSLTEDELISALPFLTKHVSVFEFMKEKSRQPANMEINTSRLWLELNNLIQQLKMFYPDVASHIQTTRLVDMNGPSTPKQKSWMKSITKRVTKFIDDLNIPQQEALTMHTISSKELTNFIVCSDEGQLYFKTVLMPAIYSQNKDSFLKFSVELVNSYDIGQQSYSHTLRNHIGNIIEQVLGLNVFVPRDDMVNEQKKSKADLKEILELNFFEKDEKVAGYLNVSKALTWFLSKAGINSAIPMPNDKLLIYVYTDAFPWMLWSKFFSGETSIRMKVVEPHNLMSTIITVCQWLGPDDYSHVSTFGSLVFSQLKQLKEIVHPISNQKIQVLVRGLADEASRSTSTGLSSQAAMYPITEAPEHKTQLGDMTTICLEPTRTVEKAEEMANELNNWLGNKKPNIQNRREFAKTHHGYTGRKNVTEIDLTDFYPGTMHKCLRATETIVRRIGVIAESFGAKEIWFREVRKVARKVTEAWDVKFDQVGVLAFYKQAPELLANAGFSGITLAVLSDFCSDLHSLFHTVQYTPLETTRSTYDVNARVLLGFNFVLIFGTQSVTATIKHLVSYMGYYIDKALSDANQVGLPLSLRNFSDGIMETKHKEGKQGNFIYSGGKTGESGKVEYQKRVLEQQFCNEWTRISTLEDNERRSSASKAKKKLEAQPSYYKKKQEHVPFQEMEQKLDNVETECEKQEQDDEERICKTKVNPKVPENYIEIEPLKECLLQSAHHSFQTRCEEPIVVITDDSATQHSIQRNLHSHTKGTVHLSSLSLDKKNEEKYTDVLRWKRKDERVTHDILRVKSTSNQLCIEHRSPDESTMQKLTIELRSVMGCELSADTLTVDVFEPPLLQVKDEKLWKTIQMEGRHDSPTCNQSFAFRSFRGPCRVHVVSKPIPCSINKPAHNFNTLLSQHPLLQSSLEGGLQTKYQHVQEQNPHESFPLIQDPTLVRAAQIAVLTFLNGNNDVEATINLYRGLFPKFASLLSERQRCKEE